MIPSLVGGNQVLFIQFLQHLFHGNLCTTSSAHGFRKTSLSYFGIAKRDYLGSDIKEAGRE